MNSSEEVKVSVEPPIDCGVMQGRMTEERYLHEGLAMLQQSYAKAAKPYMDRLVWLESIKPPQPFTMMVTAEQAAAIGLTVHNTVLCDK